MRADKKTIGGIAVLMFFVLGICIIFYRKYIFMKDYKLAKGTVTEITLPGWKSSGNYSILYAYYVGNKLYRNNENYYYCSGMSLSDLKTLLIGKQFPLAYSTNDPNMCSIILTQENADGFHYQLPDSIKYYDSVLTCK